MADLSYDITALTALGTKMRRLSSELDADGGLGSVSTAEVNSSDVRSALEEFADNWDDKRTETSKSLSSLAEMVDKAVETFTEADKELAAKAREILEQRETQQTSQEAAQGRERDRIETGQTS